MTAVRRVSLYDRPLIERRPPITERVGPADIEGMVAANVEPDAPVPPALRGRIEKE